MKATPRNPSTEFEDREKRTFGDFSIDCVSRSELVEWFRKDFALNLTKPRVVMDVNGHGLSLARTDPDFRNDVSKADIIHCDGGFLVTLSKRMAGPQIPERSATTDMIHDFATEFEKSGNSFFLLGATEPVNSACEEILRAQYPKMKIAGRRNGFFASAEDENELISQINQSGADVVWLGMGKPLEQQMALRLKEKLNCTWIITCGGCFNYLTGHYPRAPKWMQEFNLEWLHRLATNPRQLFWRYVTTNPHALWIALNSPKKTC
ncbi:WecB/TagA/CpsF family glycosyltransferase [Celeribacter sp.]|uniref:WecB/TagA/CpsF family glycosyltransferase n=1 Tax=Celeribacter sp. TaxID=1890673 RepID=UPI003A8F1D24